MKFRKNAFIIAAVIFVTYFSAYSQERWSPDPRTTMIYAGTDYMPLPQYGNNYVHQNNQVRILMLPSGINSVNPNFRVHPSPFSTQSEVIIVRDPLNPSVMLGSSNAVSSGGTLFISEGVYVTTNGGTNWFGSDTVNSTPVTGHGGDPGPTIDKNGVFIMTHLGYPSPGMFANYSSNFGLTWSSSYTIVSGSQDKNFAGTDDAASSPYYGRSYCVWSRFTASLPPIAVSYTTNSGVSWSSSANINSPPSGHYSQGCDIRVGPNGEVYVCWAAPIAGSPYTEDFAGFAKSTNGGASWTVTENAYDMNGIRGSFATKNNIRVNGFTRIDVDRSGGSRNGWIYIVTGESNLPPAGTDPDIIMHRSTDAGVTWSAGIRVNQDLLSNGKYQWFPAVRVDEFGGVNVVYYDDRNVLANQAEVYISRSIDGGNTWTDILMSDHNFAPSPIPGLAGGYQGDYIGITSGNNRIWPLWMDNSSGSYQAWTTSLDLGPNIVHNALPDTTNLNGPYAVNCVITPAGSPIDSNRTYVFWTRTALFLDSVRMSNTGGNNWIADIPGNGLPGVYRYYIQTVDMMNRVATHPAGAPINYHQFTVSPILGIGNNGNLPEKFYLRQNYPNPFNPSTSIKFGIPSNTEGKTNVTLVIFDVLGKEVATLLNGELSPGNYELKWSGNSSGVYFYRLSASTNGFDFYRETKKMLIVK